MARGQGGLRSQRFRDRQLPGPHPGCLGFHIRCVV